MELTDEQISVIRSMADWISDGPGDESLAGYAILAVLDGKTVHVDSDGMPKWDL